MDMVSQFTVVRDLAERGLTDHVFVFNTLSGKCTVLADGDWRALSSGLAGEGEAGHSLSSARTQLLEWGILVAPGVDERMRYEAGFAEARHNPRAIYPILAVTTACNTGCTYCYEEGVTPRTMSAQVIDGVLQWMARRVVLDGIRQIHPNLFGGEPLMYPRILFRLMDGLNEIAQRHACARPEYSMSSNGMLLTPQLGRDLAERGLALIQISLDGPAETHDQRRIGHRGQPTFAECLGAVRIAADTIPNVTVKVNFDRHNRERIAELFDLLVVESLAERVTVKLEAVALQIGEGTAHDPAHVIPPESPELGEAYVELMVEAKTRGIRINPHTAHTTPCMFVSEHGVIIGPAGDIYKCISLIGREQFRVGTVFEEVYNDEYEHQMEGTKRTAECWEERCAYIPVCAGGCAYESVVRTGRYDLRFCTKDYLAELHYKRHLLRYERQLSAMGVRPLEATELRTKSETSSVGRRGSRELPVVRTASSRCGCGT